MFTYPSSNIHVRIKSSHVLCFLLHSVVSFCCQALDDQLMQRCAVSGVDALVSDQQTH